MAAPDTVVDFAEKLAAFDELWSPKIIGQVNDLHVKAVKLLGSSSGTSTTTPTRPSSCWPAGSRSGWRAATTSS